jgi:hypothetical protein
VRGASSVRVGAKAARPGVAATFIGPRAGHLGVRACGTGAHGTDAGAGPTPAQGSAREGMTGGARPSAAAAAASVSGLRWAGSQLGRDTRRVAKRPAAGNPGSTAGLGDYGLKLKRAKTGRREKE